MILRHSRKGGNPHWGTGFAHVQRCWLENTGIARGTHQSIFDKALEFRAVTGADVHQIVNIRRSCSASREIESVR